MKPASFVEVNKTVGHIRARKDKVVGSSIESFGLPHLGEAYDTFEKYWEGGFSSGNYYRTITGFFVTTVLLSHYD